MAALQIDDLAGAVRDTTYVSVGLAVIAFQRLQVRRQELARAIESGSGDARGAFDVVGAVVSDRLKLVEERVSAALDITRR